MGWFFLLTVEGLAVVFDLDRKKIPNALIVSGLLLGLSWQLCAAEINGIVSGVMGGITALLVLSFLHYFKMLGAGDIKLFIVTGIFLGSADVLKLICLSFVIAAILSLVVILKYRIVLHRFSYLLRYIKTYIITGKWEPYIKEENDTAYLHFSIPMFLGSILLLFLRRRLLT